MKYGEWVPDTANFFASFKHYGNPFARFELFTIQNCFESSQSCRSGSYDTYCLLVGVGGEVRTVRVG